MVSVDSNVGLLHDDDCEMNNLMQDAVHIENPLASDEEEGDRCIGTHADLAMRDPHGESIGLFSSEMSTSSQARTATLYMANPLAPPEDQDTATAIAGAEALSELLANDSNWRAAVDQEGHAYFIHATTGATTYEMPACIAREQLGHQRDCRERLMVALEALDATGLAANTETGYDAELMELRAELAADLQVVERACTEAVDSDTSDGSISGVPISAVELEAVLLRTDTNLARLESIGMERFQGEGVDGVAASGSKGGRSLWALAREGVGNPEPRAADPWSMVLEHVRRVRANLKPVVQAQREEQEVSGDAWLRTLKGKLRKVQTRRMTTDAL